MAQAPIEPSEAISRPRINSRSMARTCKGVFILPGLLLWPSQIFKRVPLNCASPWQDWEVSPHIIKKGAPTVRAIIQKGCAEGLTTPTMSTPRPRKYLPKPAYRDTRDQLCILCLIERCIKHSFTQLATQCLPTWSFHRKQCSTLHQSLGRYIIAEEGLQGMCCNLREW